MDIKTIRFNGEPTEVKSATIAELLSELQIAEKRVAVEQNKEIVPRSAYEQAEVCSGDTIEIVQFVGGG